MRLLWSERYLWIHLAGFAVLPIALEICLLGLAVGDPLLPVWLELLLLGVVGIGPALWMQLQRPFYIFSLLAVTLKPSQLTENQRRILSLFTAPAARLWSIAAAVVAAIILFQLYKIAPIAAAVTPFAAGGRGWGLLIAAIAFFVSNVFLQVPVSVGRILLLGDAKLLATEPFPLEQVGQKFTVFGLPVNQILPAIAPEQSLEPDQTIQALSPPPPADSAPQAATESADLWD